MKRAEILDTAKTCVCGNREQDYGTPENNFTTIAELWQTYLKAKYGLEISLNAVDTAAMLSLLKIWRVASGHAKDDNWVDLVGYAACGGELECTTYPVIDELQG